MYVMDATRQTVKNSGREDRGGRRRRRQEAIFMCCRSNEKSFCSPTRAEWRRVGQEGAGRRRDSGEALERERRAASQHVMPNQPTLVPYIPCRVDCLFVPYLTCISSPASAATPSADQPGLIIEAVVAPLKDRPLLSSQAEEPTWIGKVKT